MAAMAGLPTELCNIAALDPYLSVASFGITAPEITASAMMLGSSATKLSKNLICQFAVLCLRLVKVNFSLKNRPLVEFLPIHKDDLRFDALKCADLFHFGNIVQVPHMALRRFQCVPPPVSMVTTSSVR